MSQVEICKVKSATERKMFIGFPRQLCRPRHATICPLWVPSLLGSQWTVFGAPGPVHFDSDLAHFEQLFWKNRQAKGKLPFSYRRLIGLKPSPKVRRVVRLRSHGIVVIRKLDMSTDFGRVVENLHDVYTVAWNEWGFVPGTCMWFPQLSLDLKLPTSNQALSPLKGVQIPKGQFRLLAGSKKFGVLHRAAFAVGPKYRNRGIATLGGYDSYQRNLKNGFAGAEFSWILEDNLDLRTTLENWGAENYKTHRIYRKEFS